MLNEFSLDWLIYVEEKQMAEPKMFNPSPEGIKGSNSKDKDNGVEEGRPSERVTIVAPIPG